MNKMRCLLSAITVLVVMAGCGKKVDVAFSTSTINVAPEGETVEVALTSNGDWAVDTYPEWLTVNPTSGNGDATLTLSVTLNDSDAVRSGELRVSTKDNSATLTVTQDIMEKDFIVVSPESIECEDEGGIFTLDVTSNCDWRANVSVDWIALEPANGSGNGTVAVTIAPIEGDVEFRETNIFFTGVGSELHPIHVLQYVTEHIYISITPHILSFDYEGGSQTISLNSNGHWVAESDADWITMDATSGDGDVILTVTATENEAVLEERMGNITFSAETGVNTVLVVKQEGAPDPHYLEVAPTALNFVKDGGTAEITISCDEQWSAEAEAEWVSLSTHSGEGDGVVMLTAEPNIVNEARHTAVTVVSRYLTQRVIVTQEAGETDPIVSVSPDTLYVSYSGGLNHLSITSNTDWRLVSADEWIGFLTSTGTGDAELDFIVDLNESEEGREGVIKVMHGLQIMCRVVVVQEGRPSILETDVIEINARPEGGEYTVHVTSNQSWNIETSAEWLSCDPLSGSNNGVFVVRIDPLASIQPRSTEIRIYGSYGSYIVIPVTQSN